jgi:hypothetical protein
VRLRQVRGAAPTAPTTPTLPSTPNATPLLHRRAPPPSSVAAHHGTAPSGLNGTAALPPSALLHPAVPPPPPMPPPRAYGTLRDWEWMDIAMAVDVSRDDQLTIAQTIACDAAFLASQGMLDYSLLVAIHRLPPNLSTAARDAHIATLCRHGGFASVDRCKVYFFGIIDVLEKCACRAHTGSNTSTPTRTPPRTHAHTHACARAHAHAHTHIRTHAHTHTRTRTPAPAHAHARSTPVFCGCGWADNVRWKVQNLVLTAGYHLLLRGPDALGISALPPFEYAERFVTFILHEVLNLLPEMTNRLLASLADGGAVEVSRITEPAHPPPRPSPPTEQPTFRRSSSLLRSGSLVDKVPPPCYSPTSYSRWRHLWERRRRGLVKLRIEDDRQDQLRRIEELERELAVARAAAAGGV